MAGFPVGTSCQWVPTGTRSSGLWSNSQLGPVASGSQLGIRSQWVPTGNLTINQLNWSQLGPVVSSCNIDQIFLSLVARVSAAPLLSTPGAAWWCRRRRGLLMAGGDSRACVACSLVSVLSELLESCSLSCLLAAY